MMSENYTYLVPYSNFRSKDVADVTDHLDGMFDDPDCNVADVLVVRVYDDHRREHAFLYNPLDGVHGFRAPGAEAS